jgi:hypothetical protein
VSFLVDETPELTPLTGVITSQNAEVLIGGLVLMKVSDITVRYGNQVGVYAEVGDRKQTPYAGSLRVSGTINRAYINGAEWRLLIGYPANQQAIGKVNEYGVTGNDHKQDLFADANNPLAAVTKLGHQLDSLGRSNYYPIKTDILLRANKDDALPVGLLDSLVGSTPYTGELLVKRALFDAGGISFNENGLITSGAITFEGEALQLVVA